MKLISYLCLIFLTSVIYSCDKKPLYEEVQSIEDGKWHQNNIKTFDVELVDTSAIYQIYVKTENSELYSYANLWLFVSTQGPDSGLFYRDTFECLIADKTGKWYGKKEMGGNWQHNIPYKLMKIPTAGKYSISVQQAMRHEIIENINYIGLRINVIKKPDSNIEKFGEKE